MNFLSNLVTKIRGFVCAILFILFIIFYYGSFFVGQVVLVSKIFSIDTIPAIGIIAIFFGIFILIITHIDS